MNSVFITGISTAGKSTLAGKLAAEFGIRHVNNDHLRGEMVKDPALEPWANFYHNKNEAAYYATTSFDQCWQDLVLQSEAIWPTMKRKMKEIAAVNQAVIFEGVNLLPHLMNELPFKGIVMLGSSKQEIFERLKNEPRWGSTEELQRLEAVETFDQVRRYLVEAEKYCYPTFGEPHAAEDELRKLIQQSA